MVAILVSAICALIDAYGGFAALLQLIKKVFKGEKGGKLGMGMLVGAMDIATANNTVAIVMSNPIAKEMAEAYYLSEIAASTPDVRSDLVAKVKDKIKDPNYINSAVISSVADRFLDSIGL